MHGSILAFVIAVVFIAAFALSLASGAPHQLPSVAMSSPLLFHTERAAVGAALIAGLLAIVVNIFRAGVPTELSTTGAKWTMPPGTTFDPKILEQLLESQRATSDALKALVPVAGEQGLKVQAIVDRIDSAVDKAQRREKVADAITGLPDREQLVFALTFVERLRDRDIASLLQVSPQRVRQLRQQALQRLGEDLGENVDWQEWFRDDG